MKLNRFFVIPALLACVCFLAIAQAPQRPAADPATPVFWTAAQMKEFDSRLAARQDPVRHNAGARLIVSANVIYRTGPSQSEIHQKQGEIIFIREGEGSIWFFQSLASTRVGEIESIISNNFYVA